MRDVKYLSIAPLEVGGPDVDLVEHLGELVAALGLDFVPSVSLLVAFVLVAVFSAVVAPFRLYLHFLILILTIWTDFLGLFFSLNELNFCWVFGEEGFGVG